MEQKKQHEITVEKLCKEFAKETEQLKREGQHEHAEAVEEGEKKIKKSLLKKIKDKLFHEKKRKGN